MRKFLWGVFALCVAAMSVAAVKSVAEDVTAPDRSLTTVRVGDCVGFADQGRPHEDPGSAQVADCRGPDARYRVLADGDLGPAPGRDVCAAFRDTAKVLVIGPGAPTFGRFLCLDRLDRR